MSGDVWSSRLVLVSTPTTLPPPETAAEPVATTTDGVVRGRSLVRRFGEGETAVDALRGVDVGFEAGTFTAIMGPSGSGKSTLMHILAGLDRPTAGWVELGDVRLDELSDRELTLLRRRQIGFVFQSYNLLPVLTAEENITLPVTIGGGEPDREWLATLLDTMGIEKRRRHRPSEMSGGEQQRVAVARALISRPAVLFADEPTGNLDSAASDEILELLRHAVDEFGQTIVMVTHEAAAAAIADRLLFLADGRIVDDLRGMSVEGILDHLKALR
jgi:putative ABC transport system ATP-binding protein